jgi:hypothetical protein
MIQRVQSVFLVMIILIVGTLCSIKVLHFVVVEPNIKTTEYALNLFYFNKFENGLLVESKLQFLLIFLASIVIGLSTYTLISFKDRIKQMKFTLINMVALSALVIAFFTNAYLYAPNFTSEKLMVNSMIGITLILFVLYLNIRVFYLIKKDEALVKSADRLR